MKYALIGCGRISPNHIEAAKNNKLNFVAAFFAFQILFGYAEMVYHNGFNHLYGNGLFTRATK